VAKVAANQKNNEHFCYDFIASMSPPKKEHMPSHYGRTFLTDLLFDYFKKKNPNREKDYEYGIDALADCNTLDIFELIQQLDNSRACLGIERIPKPPEASKFLKTFRN
jgi:hypothetical protein